MSNFIFIVFRRGDKDVAGCRLSVGAGVIEALDTVLTICRDYDISQIKDWTQFPLVLWGSSSDRFFISEMQEKSQANLYVDVQGRGRKQICSFYVNNLFWEVERDEEADFKIGKLKNKYSFGTEDSISFMDLYRFIADLRDLEAQGYNAFRIGKQVWGLM